MKKTLTVNLGGTVFHIDEDAYQLLDKYLSNLRIHFRKEEGSDEIMDDFEMRISELLNERVRLGYEVITIEQVEEVIKRMGKPEEIFEEEEKSTDHEDNYRAQQQETHTQTTKKRLMRDPDNRILGFPKVQSLYLFLMEEVLHFSTGQFLLLLPHAQTLHDLFHAGKLLYFLFHYVSNLFPFTHLLK